MQSQLSAIRLILLAAIAFVLLRSGLIHAAQPYYFLQTVASYQIVESQTLLRLAVLLPYLQVVLAVCLLMNAARQTAIGMALGLFIIYAAAQFIVMLRGGTLPCGCFGFSQAAIGPATVAIPLGCAAACLVLMWLERRVVPASSLGGSSITCPS